MDFSETGIFTIGFGFFFFVTGMMCLGDKGMALAGNLLVIIGILIFTRGNFMMFLSRTKLKGTTLFVLGLAFMLKKVLVLGFFIELIGIFILISDKIPSFKNLIRNFFFKLFRFVK
ncbi:hypothetical protein TUBRATIS_12350 [Tubulinosema ratisbonensis]|uniref:Uncharacterized protein n=1 Tax=Tubulinosema ratisbonensis TaxID=291195 RepID=A0A437AM79_9MICR|nr:hypothetical protein TUBRATIS_12350 [Tubulinosema ratisbonensis]